VIVMPMLARAQRQVAAGIGSGAIHADSKHVDFCAYLSAILLSGLLLNAVQGWWWADAMTGLLMVPIIVREGVVGLRGKSCCPGCQRDFSFRRAQIYSPVKRLVECN
jgi:divalent metal cation (Fe/Co/Zn/Cd) transporter